MALEKCHVGDVKIYLVPLSPVVGRVVVSIERDCYFACRGVGCRCPESGHGVRDRQGYILRIIPQEFHVQLGIADVDSFCRKPLVSITAQIVDIQAGDHLHHAGRDRSAVSGVGEEIVHVRQPGVQGGGRDDRPVLQDDAVRIQVDDAIAGGLVDRGDDGRRDGLSVRRDHNVPDLR